MKRLRVSPAVAMGQYDPQSGSPEIPVFRLEEVGSEIEGQRRDDLFLERHGAGALESLGQRAPSISLRRSVTKASARGQSGPYKATSDS